MAVEDLRRDRWAAASYRCPCGFAGDDVGEFDRHLDAADRHGTEHFEVLEGWTLEQVWRWQAAAGAPGTPDAALASPVLTAGSGVFDGEGRPYVVRMELPLSAEQVVAVLYGDRGHLMPEDVGTDERVWAHAAVAVVQDGLAAVEELAREIEVQEASGALAAPGWLALCRRRVAEMAAVSAGLRLA
jgi:hypothetical protein